MDNEPQAQGSNVPETNGHAPIQTPGSQPAAQPAPQVPAVSTPPMNEPVAAEAKPASVTPSTSPESSSGLYMANAPASSQATATAASEIAAEKTNPHSGKMKLILIAVGILLVAGTAAGLYFSGILNPAGQNAEQLKNAAESQQAAVDNTLTSQGTPVSTLEQTQETSGLTQVAVNACQVGQVMDPVANRCACDINNNYFALNLNGAYVQPTAGQEPVQCTTCTSLIGQINDLANSSDPADVTKKAQLDALAKENNCSPCSVFDDRIASASQNKAWDKYFDLAVEKSNDKTCGRALSTCDSLKWQLLFLNDLRDKAGKDEQTSPDVLATLKQKQQSIAEELGTTTACYSIESLCTDLKKIYGDNKTASMNAPVQKTATAELIGQTQQTQEQPVTGYTQQDITMPDLNTITLDKLFDKEFYMMHCPVDGAQTQQSAVAPTSVGTQVQTGGKVSRVKRTTSVQGQTGTTTGTATSSSFQAPTASAPVTSMETPPSAPATKGSSNNILIPSPVSSNPSTPPGSPTLSTTPSLKTYTPQPAAPPTYPTVPKNYANTPGTTAPTNIPAPKNYNP